MVGEHQKTNTQGVWHPGGPGIHTPLTLTFNTSPGLSFFHIQNGALDWVTPKGPSSSHILR